MKIIKKYVPKLPLITNILDMFQMKIVIYLQPDINIVAVNKLTAAQVFVKIFLIKLN